MAHGSDTPALFQPAVCPCSSVGCFTKPRNYLQISTEIFNVKGFILSAARSQPAVSRCAALEECICSDDSENRRLESWRRATADVSTPLRCAQHDRRFFAFSEMQKGNLEVANGDRWRMGAICNLLLGESAGGNRESSAAEVSSTD